MEFGIIQIVSTENEDGEYGMVYLPTVLKLNDVVSVHPLLTSTNKLFKNVSKLETTSKTYVVPENYKMLKERVGPLKVKGFRP